MTIRRSAALFLSVVSLGTGAGLVAPGSAFAQLAPSGSMETVGLPLLDVRYSPGQGPLDSVRQAARKVRDEKARGDAIDALRAAVPGVQIDEHELFLTPHFVYSLDRFLTGPSKLAPREIVRSFVGAYAGLFEISPVEVDAGIATRDFRTDHNGATHLTYQQQIAGIDLYACWIQANLARDGALINIESTMLPRPTEGFATTPIRLTDLEAFKAAARHCGVSRTCDPQPEGEARGVDQVRRWAHTPDLRSNDPIESRLVYFPVTRTDIRAAWMVDIPVKGVGHTYDCIIDAGTGELLRREDRLVWDSTQPITMRVYTTESPRPMMPGLSAPGATQAPEVSRVLITKTPADMIPYSPNGWINDGAMETLGNNCDAHTDSDGTPNTPDLPRPNGGAGRVFDFPIDLTTLAPSGYKDAAVVQQFYLANDIHDRLYALGFNEAARNFQTINFSGLGLGNDAVKDDCQDSSGFNNANFSGTHTDGSSARVQMYVFSGPTPDRDGCLDANVVYHEHAHGVSIRLVNGLSGAQPSGMGEGWSDFFGLCLTSNDGMDPDGIYPAGSYASYMLSGFTQNYYFGIRRFPYCTDPLKNPETYRTIATAVFTPGVPRSSLIPNSTADPHNTGELWCMALWEARAALHHRYGFAANDMIMRLALDGMKLSPSNPTMVQARAAIISGELAFSGGTNANTLWWAFAKRGLGLSASSASTSVSAATEAFDVPNGISFLYPSGTPAQLNLGTSTSFIADISSRTLTVTGGSGQLFYSVDSGAFTSAPLTPLSGTRYTATIPAATPGSQIRYYLSMGSSGGTKVDPVGAPAAFFTATAPACPADLDDGSATGTPDGGVTISDLLYFLSLYEQGLIAADLDDGSGTGTPDGGVGISDLLFFLEHYEGGC